jgi:hypothetical protein
MTRHRLDFAARLLEEEFHRYIPSFFPIVEDLMRILMSLAVPGTLLAILAMGCGSSSEKGASTAPLNKDSVNKMKSPPAPPPQPK